MKRLWLTKIRKSLDKNYVEMASYLDLPLTTYTSYEKGIRNPTVSQARKLAEKLNVEWTIFFK